MYTTTYQIFTPDGKTRRPNYQCIPGQPWEGLLPDYFKSATIGESLVCSSVVCIPKNIFLKMGGFPTGCGWGEDGYLFGTIALNYPVAFSWETGGIYHFDATNRACNKGLSLDCEEPFIKMARNALDKGEVPTQTIEPLREYIYKTEFIRVERNILIGNNIVALGILKQCKTRWQYQKKVKLTILALMPHSLLQFLQEIKRKTIR
jgi:hypothetical protein